MRPSQPPGSSHPSVSFVPMCVRHADSQGHTATFCSFMLTTRRFTGSRRNIWYPCVDDTPIHQVTIQHLVHVCGRHAHPPVTIQYLVHVCGRHSELQKWQDTCGARNKVGDYFGNNR